MNTTFKIEAISQKEKTYAIRDSSDNWYSAFGKCPFNKGDNVSIEFVVSDKGFKNIKKIELALPSPAVSPVSPALDSERQKLIVRQSCLKCAVASMNKGIIINTDDISKLAEIAKNIPQDSFIIPASLVLELAEEFENWVMRE